MMDSTESAHPVTFHGRDCLESQVHVLNLMSEPTANSPTNSAFTSNTAGRLFQCVCGRATKIDAGSSQPLRCEQCGRVIAVAMLEQSLASFGATIIGSTDPHEDESLSLNSGDRLDHFTVMDLLGAGGMGAVFRARDESLQRFVALKVIRSRPGEGGRLRCERLIQEARAQARVSHPNVVHIYYVGTHDDCPFFAMEFVSGRSLASVLRERRLTFPEIIRLGLEAAGALRHSARLGIVHGDVKPANILLDEHGHVKLSDFGLASCPTTEAGGGSSHTGPAGTLNYMAPEVAAGRAADVRSDMYSLGVMLYELTFGELPHHASSDSLEENLQQRQIATIRFPATWPADRPERWREFLDRILQSDPERRFAGYDELVNELGQWQPLTLRRAGRITRLVAWLLDMLIMGLLLALLMGISVAGRKLIPGLSSLPNLQLPVFAGCALMLGWIFTRLRTTPGKRLMQLRMVDEFGLAPLPWKVTASLASTFVIFFKAILDGEFVVRVGPVGRNADPPAETIIEVLLILWLLVNGVWLLFSRRQQTLTDRLLGLFVVLDSGPAKRSVLNIEGRSDA
jgi:uncharacterized RDD family membrane protein YckC